MIKIKLSTEFPEWPIERQTPESSGIWKDCEFIINKSAEECDAWVVYDGILQEESVICSKENLIFITAEPETVRNYHHEFLNQFNTIITSNRQIKHKNIVYTQQALPWMVGRRVKNEVNISFSKDYDELKSINFYNKTKLISVISSNKVFTEGHRRRLDFVKALKEHFGDKIDVFGRGICDIEDKWDAIAPYKYHIALENSSIDDYWTEKLADCYLGGAYPFYYGCPNLSKYFSEESFASIDVNDSESSIKIIEAAIANNLYEKSIDKILESKNLILDKYNLFPMLSEFVQKNYKENNKKELITLKPEVYFINQDKTKIIKSMIRPLKPIELFFRNLRNKVLKKKKINCPKNKQIYTIDKNIGQWLESNGDKTLRLDYDLNENSIVFDLGGYHGDWTAHIFCKYGCFVHIFEPVQKFVDIIQKRFNNNKKIILHSYGIAEKDKTVSITLDEDASSVIKSSEKTEEVKLVDTVKFFNEFNIERIDLIKINIEGGEYDLLEYLIETGLIARIKNIQVQFHEFVPNAKKRMNNIQKKLSKTHELTYQFEFVWENWGLKVLNDDCRN